MTPGGPNILIENTVIYDGSGREPFEGWVLLEDGKISAVGATGLSVKLPNELVRFDAHGLALAPGFINIHSHSDTLVLTNPACKTLLKQGITTETVGNCGGSAVDTSRYGDDFWDELLRKSSVKSRWDGVRGYLEAVTQASPAVNVAPLFGHGDIRRRIAPDQGRPLSPDELIQAESIARRYMEEGAFGVSSGLEYVPGRFANVDELAAVCRGVAAYGGIHATHMRNEGPGLLEAVREVIEATKKGSGGPGETRGCRLEVSHLKACGPDSWGKVGEALELLDAAVEDGLQAGADFYPYLASSTTLAIVLPDWVLQEGHVQALDYLRSADVRLRAESEADQRTRAQGGWDRIVVTGVGRESNKWMEGLDMASIARSMERTPAQAAVDILIDEDLKVRIARFAMSEDDLCQIMRHPETCVITDGWNTVPEEGKTHPRSVGTFPRVLGYYARDKGIITVQEAVRKMTSLPAKRLGLMDRGLISVGFWGDLVVFDREKIADRATYEDPWQYPEGVFAVFVNGRAALWEGELTGTRCGRSLIRPGVRPLDHK